MALSKDEQDQLDALTVKANAPDDDDDFEIELFTPEGHGARVPYKKGRSFLQTHFGIDLDPDPGDSSDGEPGDDKSNSKSGGGKKPSSKATPENKTGAGFFRSAPRT